MNAKQIAAEKAAGYIKDGMTVGMGTGSTSAFAIQSLIERVKQGLKIKVVASSLGTEELLSKGDIPVIPFEEVETIDIYIDGADEVDGNFNLIKGGGGALMREKILAYNSEKFLVIVDGSKMVQSLGKFPLPVEIISFAHELTLKNLSELGCKASIRQKNDKNLITDNGNLIADCHFNIIENVVELMNAIDDIPGVVESGLFPSAMVSKVIVGYEDGKVDELGK